VAINGRQLALNAQERKPGAFLPVAGRASQLAPKQPLRRFQRRAPAREQLRAGDFLENYVVNVLVAVRDRDEVIPRWMAFPLAAWRL